MCDNNNEFKFDIFNKYKCKDYNPLDDITINKKSYDPNFLDLLNHIFKLTGYQSAKIKEKIDIISPEILINHPAILLDNIKQLILYINDLLKIFIKLYNLEMGISYLVKNTDFNFIKQSQHIIEDYFIKQNISDKDKEFFYKNLPTEEKFIPLEYTPYDLSILDEIKTEQDLIDVSNFFLEDFIKLEKAIKDLIKLSEKFTFILDLKSVTKLILTQIIPAEYPIENNEGIQSGGANPTVQSVYAKLIKLKSLLEGIGSDILGKEIPYSINLEINDAMKIINLFQTNLEKIAKTQRTPGIEKQYDLNLFQSVPEYIGIPEITDKFIQNPLEGQLPEASFALNDFDEINQNIILKNEDLKKKLKDISKINKELYKLDEKINQYKSDEETKQLGMIYEYTDQGSQADIRADIISKDSELRIKEGEKNTLVQNVADLTREKDNLNQLLSNPTDITDLISYIAKLRSFPNIKTDDQLLSELKNLLEKSIGGNSYDLSNYDNLFAKMKANKSDKFKKYTDNLFVNMTINDIENIEIIINACNGLGLPFYNTLFTDATLNKFYNPLFKMLTGDTSTIKQKILEKIGEIKRHKELLNVRPEILTLFNKIKTKIPDILTVLDANASINQYKTRQEQNLNAEILLKTTEIANIEREITTLTQEKTRLQTILNSLPNDNIDVKSLIELDNDKFRDIIILLQDKMDNINAKMSKLFLIKENKTTNPIGEDNISINIDDFNPTWYNKSTIVQSGGDPEQNFQKYLSNLGNMNKITEINENIRKLLITIELYKSKTTELIELYINVMKNLNSILVYLYYKLTVFKDYYNETKIISGKFDKIKLENLKNKINLLDRKNFQFIKEIFVKVIDTIISKMNTTDKKYVKYAKTTGLLNLLVLNHLHTIINLL